MSKKSEVVTKLLKKIQPRAPLPRPMKEGTLLEQGLLCVLVRHMPQEKAEPLLGKLRKMYPDWNEMRVAQVQEIASLVTTGERRGDKQKIAALAPALRDAREYLQEVFQKVHGFDLEWMRDDVPGAQKLVANMPFLGLSAASYLLYLATNKDLPVSAGLIRVLDRLGLIARGSVKKARESIEPLVPAGDHLAFVSTFGEVADRWCDVRKPICHECPLVDDCIHGKKAFADWKVQQERLAVQREREDARRLVIEKKEAARRARDDAREQKRVEAEQKKLAREREKQARIDKARKEIELRDKRKLDAEQKKAKLEADAAAKKAAVAAKAKSAAEAAKKKKDSATKKDAKKPAAKPAKKSGSKPARKAPKASRKR